MFCYWFLLMVCGRNCLMFEFFGVMLLLIILVIDLVMIMVGRFGFRIWWVCFIVFFVLCWLSLFFDRLFIMIGNLCGGRVLV